MPEKQILETMNLDNILNNIENANAKATENLDGIREQLFEVQDITIDAPFENYENPKTQVIYTSDGRYLERVEISTSLYNLARFLTKWLSL